MAILRDFKIIGKGTSTRKRRKRIYSAYSQKEAIENALADGTTPIEVIELPLEPATEKQIAFAIDLGLKIPKNPSLRLMSALISEKVDAQQIKQKKIKTKKPFIAPSGFKFPVFQYSSKTLVRIKDLTDYRNDFLALANDKSTYAQQDFEQDLSPDCLDIEIDEFSTMFKPSTLKKMGVKNPPTGWVDFHKEIQWMKEENEKLIWPMTKSVHKQLAKLGLLDILPENKETKENYFFSFSLKELKNLCRKQKIKISGPKSQIVDRIITDGKIKSKPSCTLNKKYHLMIIKLAKAYFKDIEQQLKDKPLPYSIVIWEQLSEEYGIGGELPEATKKYAENRFNELQSIYKI